jgi:ribosomal protein L37AE/L43A
LSSETETTPTNSETSPQTDGLEIELYPWQKRALFECDDYGWLALVGGRGSGKSYLDMPRILRWCDLGTDLYYGIFAPTEPQLNTVLAPIAEALRSLDIAYVFEKAPPQEWRAQWDADGTPYPPQRLRQEKIFIWENGMHIFCATILNNAYTRAKSLDFNAILLQEFTDPGVHNEVLTTLIGCLRCGRATKQKDGSHRCVVPGHIHQLVTSGNVPLRDPSHYFIKKARMLLRRESERAAAGKKAYFCLIQSRTQDNLATGEDYIERLAAAWDTETFDEQTSGDLFARRTSLLTYYQFSEKNILSSLVYDPLRPLHIWFDFNNTPAVAGWGHDLRLDEVPPSELKPKHDYFGVVGELFSDSDPMQTEQVAKALLEDPTMDGRCADCGDMLERHIPGLWVCRVCGSKCDGKPLKFAEGSRKYLHLPPPGHGKPWRGLVNHRARIYVYGDATGTASHADASKTGGSIQILRDIFGEALEGRVHFRFKTSDPRVKLRELAVNRGLCAKNGVHSHFFAPWCTAHLDDFREVVPDPKTGVAKKESKPKNTNAGNEYWKRTHMSDAWGYHVDWRWPAIIPKATGLPAMAEVDDFEAMSTGWREP